MGSIPWGGPRGDPMAQSLVGKPWDLYYGIPMGFFCKGCSKVLSLSHCKGHHCT